MLLLTKSKGHKSNSPYSGFPNHLQTKSKPAYLYPPELDTLYQIQMGDPVNKKLAWGIKRCCLNQRPHLYNAISILKFILVATEYRFYCMKQTVCTSGGVKSACKDPSFAQSLVVFANQIVSQRPKPSFFELVTYLFCRRPPNTKGSTDAHSATFNEKVHKPQSQPTSEKPSYSMY